MHVEDLRVAVSLGETSLRRESLQSLPCASRANSRDDQLWTGGVSLPDRDRRGGPGQREPRERVSTDLEGCSFGTSKGRLLCLVKDGSVS